MAILDTHTDEGELYIKALRSLDTHGTFSEHTKIPDTPEELQLMKEANKASTRKGFMFSWSKDRYNHIFKKDNA